MKNLIREYDDIFAANPKKPIRSNLVEHAIITDEALPVKRNAREFHLGKRKKLDNRCRKCWKMTLFAHSPGPGIHH